MGEVLKDALFVELKKAGSYSFRFRTVDIIIKESLYLCHKTEPEAEYAVIKELNELTMNGEKTKWNNRLKKNAEYAHRH